MELIESDDLDGGGQEQHVKTIPREANEGPRVDLNADLKATARRNDQIAQLNPGHNRLGVHQIEHWQPDSDIVL